MRDNYTLLTLEFMQEIHKPEQKSPLLSPVLLLGVTKGKSSGRAVIAAVKPSHPSHSHPSLRDAGTAGLGFSQPNPALAAPEAKQLQRAPGAR